MMGRVLAADDILRPKTAADLLACESLVGLSVGDALGAPWEGSAFNPIRLTGQVIPEGRAPWTDDTQMALAVVERLLAAGTIEPDLLASAFARRYEPWRGYGRGMHQLLPAIRDGGDWRDLTARLFVGGSYGNGSAMRVAPLGAYFHEAPADRVVIQAVRSAEVTHAHPEAKAGAIAVALAAWLAARSRGQVAAADPWAEILPHLEPKLEVTQGLRNAASLPGDTTLGDAAFRLGNGSRVTCADTVPLALWIALRHVDDFALAVRHAIAAGGDADTLGAIVGGIVAARLGVERIPPRWRAAVEPLPIG
jgi:ADP-ribosylglycohydrolase